MKRLILFTAAVVAIAMTSCSKPSENQNLRSPENEALIVKYADAAVKGDTKAMEELLADDFMSHGPALKDSANKSQTIENWKKSWAESFSSITYDRYATLSSSVKEGRIAGDWAFDWGLVSATYKDGKTPVKFYWHAVYKIKDGKINSETSFYNAADILTQQGFTFVPPADSSMTAK